MGQITEKDVQSKNNPLHLDGRRPVEPRRVAPSSDFHLLIARSVEKAGKRIRLWGRSAIIKHV